MSRLGFLFGAFLLTFNIWRLLTVWASAHPGIQWMYWLGFVSALSFCVWATTAIGRKTLAGESFSPTTVALTGFTCLISICFSLLTV